MSKFSSSVSKVAARHAYARMIEGAALTDVSNLRYQAVFLMGTGGSGKTYVGHRWMKFMPGGGSAGYTDRKVWEERVESKMTEQERNLSNLDFVAAKDRLEDLGFRVEIAEGGTAAKIPFRLYTYDMNNKEVEVDPDDYKDLPADVVDSLRKARPDIEKLTEVIFGTPIHELPTYWRQVNPDLYKEELAGYVEEQPGYVHEMSSEMSKAYFEGVLETGDPLMVDGTGANIRKMTSWVQKAQQAGYKVSVVYVYVPLTVSMIRNATRSRNVAVASLIEQFRAISKNYAKLRTMVDKAHFIDNRNTPHDVKTYKKNADKINNFVKESSNGKYENLYELIRDVAPTEISDYGWLLEGAESEPKTERQREIERIREERGYTGLKHKNAKSVLAELYKRTIKLAGLAPMPGEVFWPSEN